MFSSEATRLALSTLEEGTALDCESMIAAVIHLAYLRVPSDESVDDVAEHKDHVSVMARSVANGLHAGLADFYDTATVDGTASYMMAVARFASEVSYWAGVLEQDEKAKAQQA